ncbi:hypothetical protein EJ03DRAFT_375432 [Teratosphaeria nubilosa]|uniref:DNA2/NAM7 helicase helicase domain-containing protein n=1 Tax=Teratosphaeria nubilosa TaxID=161662 RepID=A0A6G1L5U0_9PEZI|nr:hypothetical protein EJ03DRAFT_375432 [Teratosphaeria nubilosa]
MSYKPVDDWDLRLVYVAVPSEMAYLRDLTDQRSVNTKLALSPVTNVHHGQFIAFKKLLCDEPGGFDLEAKLLGSHENLVPWQASQELPQSHKWSRGSAVPISQADYDDHLRHLERSLDASQKIAFGRICRDRMSDNLALIIGPPGTGKTRLGSGICLALAAGQSLLIIAQNNASLDALTNEILKWSHDLSEEILETLRICRVYPNKIERQKIKLLAFNEKLLAASRMTLASAILLGVTTVKCQMSRTSVCPAWHPGSPLVLKSASTAIAISACKRFDEENKALGSMLLKHCNLVLTTIDQCPKIENDYRPDVLFIDEVSVVPVPQAAKAVKCFASVKMVIAAGDLKQLGPVLPSSLDERNEFGKLLETSFIEACGPLSTEQMFTLKRNYRSPPSILAVSRGFYAETNQMLGFEPVQIESMVRASESDAIKSIQQARQRTTDTVPDWLKALRLGETQQYWFDVVGGHGRILAGDDSKLRPTGEDTQNALFACRSKPRCVNYHTLAGVRSVVQALLDRCHLAPEDVLVQGLTADDADLLHACLVDINASVPVKDITASAGGQAEVVITHLPACSCLEHARCFQPPTSRLFNVAISRARSLQILVGSRTCNSRHIRNPKSLYSKMMDHVGAQNEIVAFDADTNDIRDVQAICESV